MTARLLALVLGIAVSAAAQAVSFTPLPPAEIEARLQQAKGNNAERHAVLTELLKSEGCTGERLTEQPVEKGKPANLICVLPGETPEQIVVGAHFDRVPQAPGIVDNWTGAALLPSLLHAVKNTPRKHTFVFVGFTEEERGLIGSRHYVRKLSKQERARIRAMINLDTLGLTPTKVWANGSDERLTGVLVAIAQALKLPVSAVNFEQVGTTDSEPFRREKIPAIAIHSVDQATYTVLHSDRDRLDSVDLAAYYDTYKLVAAYLAFLDARLPLPEKQKK